MRGCGLSGSADVSDLPRYTHQGVGCIRHAGPRSLPAGRWRSTSRNVRGEVRRQHPTQRHVPVSNGHTRAKHNEDALAGEVSEGLQLALPWLVDLHLSCASISIQVNECLLVWTHSIGIREQALVHVAQRRWSRPTSARLPIAIRS